MSCHEVSFENIKVCSSDPKQLHGATTNEATTFVFTAMRTTNQTIWKKLSCLFHLLYFDSLICPCYLIIFDVGLKKDKKLPSIEHWSSSLSPLIYLAMTRLTAQCCGQVPSRATFTSLAENLHLSDDRATNYQ
jgi:hypothetical protein